MKVCFEYYKDLYTKEEEDTEQQEYFLKNVDIKVSEEDSTMLEGSITEGELYEALRDLNDNRSPGYSGLTKEFYIKFWDDLKCFYMDSIGETLRDNELSEMQKRGSIKISFKKDDRSRLDCYRPITLLNVDLKILTKLLSKRLNKVLPYLINLDQKCVSGRHITDNIHLVQDAIDLINANDDKAAFVLFDMQKAFDRLSHTFLFKVLSSFGFGSSFIQWVKILLRDVKSFVRVNGFETEEFDVQRGVRQGCCLSPLLFVLASEVLAMEIRNNTNIKGYKLDTYELKVGQYADDLTVCISELTSLDELFKVMGKYEHASNSKLNVSKTKGLWVGKWSNRSDKPKDLNWYNDKVELLGVFVGNRKTKLQYKQLCNINFEEIKNKINSKINFWRGNKLSIKGKIRVVNSFILSKLYYRLEVVDIPVVTIKEIETLLFAFIWSNKIAGRVNRNVLLMGYESGGLQLYDMIERMKIMRVKWLRFILSLSEKDVRRIVVDKLIGSFRQIKGIKILHHDIGKKLPIKSLFYEKAMNIWKSMKIEVKCQNKELIHNEIVYKSHFFKKSDNTFFKFPNLSNKKSYMPLFFKDLPVTTNLTKIDPYHRNIISELNKCFWRISRANIQEGHIGYWYQVENEKIDIAVLPFRKLYKN